jgi:murein DD-endopeptidase MepM/ murein hydrolase activator NlpD
VRDWSWRGALAGNETRRDLPLRVDLEPPRIEVTSGISGITYVRQGGSGSVAYRVSEPTARDGVRVGTSSTAASRARAAARTSGIALFAVPPTGRREGARARVRRGCRGQQQRAGWSVVVQPYVQPEGKVQLRTPSSRRSFRVSRRRPPRAAPDSAFQDCEHARACREREAHPRADRRLGTRAALRRQSAPARQFEGDEPVRREAHLHGRWRELSRAVHYGYDLRSLSGAPVTADGRGRVLYAGDLGIYGNCVILDHGLGLTSLYGHLSQIDV